MGRYCDVAGLGSGRFFKFFRSESDGARAYHVAAFGSHCATGSYFVPASVFTLSWSFAQAVEFWHLAWLRAFRRGGTRNVRASFGWIRWTKRIESSQHDHLPARHSYLARVLRVASSRARGRRQSIADAAMGTGPG